jgi:hypothetical protein
MSRLNFSVTRGVPLAAGFTDLPPGVRAYLTEGLSALGRLNDDQRRTISKSVLEAFSSRQNLDEIHLSDDLKLEDSEAKTALAGATFLAANISTMSGTAHEIITAMQGAKLIESAQIANLLQFAQLIEGERTEIEKRIDLRRLESEVLPSLDGLDITVDLRLKFRKGKTDLAVPVAIFHLDTDAYHQQVWFQASKSDVERMLKQLKDTLEQMEKAEEWASWA